jgi:peptide/nickel transport system ATP-binding protein
MAEMTATLGEDAVTAHQGLLGRVRVAVMYRVETGDAAAVTATPDHPYTQRLLLAAPVPDPKRQAERREARRQLAAVAA